MNYTHWPEMLLNWPLLSSPKYLLEEYDDSTFHALFVANGFVKIEWDENKSIEIKKGRSVLIPASLKKYKMIGQGKIIRTSV